MHSTSPCARSTESYPGTQPQKSRAHFTHLRLHSIRRSLRLHPAQTNPADEEALGGVEEEDEREAAHHAGGEDARPVLAVLVAEEAQADGERVVVLVAEHDQRPLERVP